jgi:hypothetical protein
MAADWAAIEQGLRDWSFDLPHDYPGEDWTGESCAEFRLRESVEGSLQSLLIDLHASQHSGIGEIVRKRFDALFEQATAIDQWCKGKRPPEGELHWSQETVAAAVGDPRFRTLNLCFDAIRDAQRAVNGKPDPKGDRADKSGGQKNISPPSADVVECARYILQQRKRIAAGKRLTATKRALISEHVGALDAPAMETALRPSRYGYLLRESGHRADK